MFCVITNDRLHYFAAEDSDEMFRWIDLLSPQVIIMILYLFNYTYLHDVYNINLFHFLFVLLTDITELMRYH